MLSAIKIFHKKLIVPDRRQEEKNTVFNVPKSTKMSKTNGVKSGSVHRMRLVFVPQVSSTQGTWSIGCSLRPSTSLL